MPSKIQNEIHALLRPVKEYCSLKSTIQEAIKITNKISEGLSTFLSKKYLTKGLERVLVIPISLQHQKNSEYELIFGWGDVITRDDLFIYWNSSTQEAKSFPFNFDTNNLNPLCGAFASEKLQTIFGDEYESQIIHYLGIEEIKFYLKRRKGYLGKNKILFEEFRNDSDLRKLKIKPTNLDGPLRHLNVFYRLYPSVSFLTLKDVFLNRWDFKYKTYELPTKNNKNTACRLLEYNPYEVVRSFLRTTKIMPEKRKGKYLRRRYSKEEIDIIIDSYLQYGRKKSLEEVIDEHSIPPPTVSQLKSLQKELKLR